MDYQQFIQKVKEFDFIENDEQADAAVKAVLGTLASRLREPEAHKMTEKLPEPLTYEKLRGQQVYTTPISVDEYERSIGQQFHIGQENARKLIRTVFDTAKDAIGNETVKELEKALPDDWARLMEAA